MEDVVIDEYWTSGVHDERFAFDVRHVTVLQLKFARPVNVEGRAADTVEDDAVDAKFVAHRHVHDGAAGQSGGEMTAHNAERLLDGELLESLILDDEEMAVAELDGSSAGQTCESVRVDEVDAYVIEDDRVDAAAEQVRRQIGHGRIFHADLNAIAWIHVVDGAVAPAERVLLQGQVFYVEQTYMQ